MTKSQEEILNIAHNNGSALAEILLKAGLMGKTDDGKIKRITHEHLDTMPAPELELWEKYHVIDALANGFKMDTCQAYMMIAGVNHMEAHGIEDQRGREVAASKAIQ